MPPPKPIQPSRCNTAACPLVRFYFRFIGRGIAVWHRRTFSHRSVLPIIELSASVRGFGIVGLRGCWGCRGKSTVHFRRWLKRSVHTQIPTSIADTPNDKDDPFSDEGG